MYFFSFLYSKISVNCNIFDITVCKRAIIIVAFVFDAYTNAAVVKDIIVMILD